MSYISQEDYKSLMTKFQAETTKGMLKEAVEEGNAFTAALAKTKKGEKAKVGGKEITDTSGYDDPTVKEGNDEVDKKLERIADLHKGKKIDFETIEKIAKAIEAQGHEVNARYVQQFLSQHGVGMNEYGYADNYPGSWGYREGKEDFDFIKNAIESASGDTISHIEEDDYGRPIYWSTEHPEVVYFIGSEDQIIKYDGKSGERYPVGDLKHYDTAGDGNIDEAYADEAPSYDYNGKDLHVDNQSGDPDYPGGKASLYDKDGNTYTGIISSIDKEGFIYVDPKSIKPAKKTKEGLTTPPLQATGPTISVVENTVANPPYGFDVLSPDERKQLKEYIESIKTIKKEIARLTAKAGKKVKEGDLGGDRTGLTMTPSTVSEAMKPEQYDYIESQLDTKLHDAFETVVDRIIKNLKAEGVEEDMIEMFLKHEIEKKGKEAIMGQHDPY